MLDGALSRKYLNGRGEKSQNGARRCFPSGLARLKKQTADVPKGLTYTRYLLTVYTSACMLL
jgi:hypothetical protein